MMHTRQIVNAIHLLIRTTRANFLFGFIIVTTPLPLITIGRAISFNFFCGGVWVCPESWCHNHRLFPGKVDFRAAWSAATLLQPFDHKLCTREEGTGSAPPASGSRTRLTHAASPPESAPCRCQSARHAEAIEDTVATKAELAVVKGALEAHGHPGRHGAEVQTALPPSLGPGPRQRPRRPVGGRRIPAPAAAPVPHLEPREKRT